MMQTTRSFHLISLGCPKNEVDAECMSAALRDAGYIFESDPARACVLIVNTCAFIEPAVEEAIDAILDVADIKARSDEPQYIVVTGCLSQRYKQDIFDALPEVDAILGTGEYGAIVSVCDRLLRGESLRDELPGRAGTIDHLDIDRIPSSPPATYAYIKIAEGCSNACAFCAIPRLRGPQRSRPVEAIVAEAKRLVARGVKELILVAQDTTRYGLDIYGEPSLAKLLRRLAEDVPEAPVIRCLYFYADMLTDELIDVMATTPAVAHYVDLPIQHASDRILRAMRRHETADVIVRRIERLRAAMPDVMLRTTVMTGFPGETEDDVRRLIDLIEAVRFDRLGCFVFSPEEGTRAAQMPDRVPEDVGRRRRDQVMAAQKPIALASNERRVETVTPVLLEGVDDHGILFRGRSYGEAPDIDPVIYVAATTPDLTIGSRPLVHIIEAKPYELLGVTTHEFSE